MRIVVVTFCVTAILSAVAYAAGAQGTQPTSVPAETHLRIVYFYSPTCLKCEELKKVLDRAEKRWGDGISIERHNIQEAKGLDLMLEYEDRYGSEEAAAPKIFLGRQYLAGADNIMRRLDDVIAKELPAAPTTQSMPASTPAATTSAATTRTDSADEQPLFIKRFGSFRVAALISAGLIDGVNPCAFTTVVFLLSTLTYLHKSRRDVAIVGTSFTVAVFVTYLLLGLGMFGAIKVFAVSHGVSAALTYVIGALTLALAVWSFIDGVRFVRTGKVPAGALGMPQWAKKGVHKVIRTGLKTSSLAIGSFGMGCLVSLLESVCTGQVYLPTIMLVVRTPGLSLHAFGYLILYNVMFILPLVAILIASYWFTGSDRLGRLMQRHLGAAKFLLAALFLGLGLLLLATV
ncbi:MAG: hypothetical protein WC869_06995 [Phycisphaerae bacterium]|jgi:thiol-disulfide isomerase/thioredoxin